MRVEGRRYRDEWLPNYYPARHIGEQRVRLSRVGTSQALTPEQDRQLSEISMEEDLFRRLEATGHIITKDNSSRVLQDLEVWHHKTFNGPSLHIVVLTKRCNLNCTYCHMNPVAIGSDPEEFDLTEELADSVIEFALNSPNPRINFEFQGGEPFLNFPVMQYFVGEAERRGEAAGKKLGFSVVSNLMLVQDEHMDFCREHNINVSYSLNGPPQIHDTFRVTRSGVGSFRHVDSKLEHLQAEYSDVISSSPLCVVGADNAHRLREMLDWYHGAGFNAVSILKLKHLGNAKSGDLPFDIHDFLEHYLDALDYLYEKNRDLGEVYSERMLRVVLGKIISRSDVGFVDWRNPVGDFGSAVTYDYDGTILPSDEARSLRPAFELGNVRDVTYDQVIHREETFRSMNLSLRDRDGECRECPWNPYCGVLPVLDHARTGDPTPRPHESEECLHTIAILDWTFEKLLEDPIPLMRMLPGMDDALVRMAGKSDAADGVAGEAAHGAPAAAISASAPETPVAADA